MLSGLASVKDTILKLQGSNVIPKELMLRATATLDTAATTQSGRMSNLQKKTYMNGFLSKQTSILESEPRGVS